MPIGDRTWLIYIKQGGECLAAANFTGSRNYIPALCAIARYIDENSIDCLLNVMPPRSQDVKVFDSEDIKRFADAARHAGISATFEEGMQNGLDKPWQLVL